MKIFNIIALSFFISACTANKKSQNSIPEYVVINYSSVCCGPQSDKPVQDFLKSYAKDKKQVDFVVIKKQGIGREGEFELYINIEPVKNKKDFLIKLEEVTKLQNDKREQSQGFVHLIEKTVHAKDIDNILTTSK